MPTLDWIFLAVLLISLLVGAWRGLVYELLSVVNWIAAFVLVFVSSLFAGGLLAFLISKLVAAVGLRPVDRVLGAAFGLVRGVILLLAFAVVFGMTPLVKGPLWRESVGAGIATVALQGLKPVLPQEFGKYLP